MTDQLGSELLHAVRDHLAEIGLPATSGPPRRPDSDGLLCLDTPAGPLTYDLQLKTKVTASSAATAPRDKGRLLVTSYVSEAAAEVLRRNGVHYVDSAGNMYLQNQGLLIDIRGRRKPSARARPATLRAFQASGIRVIFSLLSEPLSVTAPYRTIAERSTASLGTVQQVLTDLTNSGFLYNGRQRRLQRLGDLFDRWVEAYTINLWPKLVLGRFDATDHGWWRSADLTGTRVQWGGETAARRLETHLVPERAIIYATELPTQLIIANRLRKAQRDGDVEIRRRFWNFDDASHESIVPTPLVYADLLASGDPRQREAADQLRKTDETLRRLVNS